ncbi:sulfatase-like hydrolase/transferase [Reichenbachiella carrageenanivorans]|uniref:Sulfatase-like hydrolase/transferase n=1 Tax=Reichenbachiella carrageenanivorans TaxID=2979869 RepID=A0ABY6D118_9BACT|nr:sulfatase-like hydrolase/transferase [Reichenbachiella carrageenanivorans]UXX79857.1 sulfatase-like hydrolase/transferase [Reichenbachiella carrageenanivorans]
MLNKLHLCCITLIWLFCLAQINVTQGQKKATDSPNIIFIFSDDWGYGDIGNHGSTFCKTPNLDQMMDEGLELNNFTVNHPVCSPSRAAVVTGQFPARNSIHRHFADISHNVQSGMPDWLDPNIPMLPRMIQEAGYRTGHFGKWHLTNRGIAGAPLPAAYGYDEYAGFNGPGEAIATDQTIPKALDFIRENADKPFFVNLWLHEPHTPHFPKQEYLQQFEHLNEQQQIYAAVIAEADYGVGQVFDLLKELSLDEKTLVIFSSDNGPESTGGVNRKKHGDKGFGTYYSVGETGGLKGNKRSLFAGGVRVPFIARWPGVIEPGTKDTTSVITAVDLLPTFVELTNAKMPKKYEPDGESILGVLKGTPTSRTKTIYWEWLGNHTQPYLWPHLGIRKGPWKLMINEEMSKSELYNIEEDWAEENDISGEFPEITNELLKELKKWKKELPTAPNSACFSISR